MSNKKGFWKDQQGGDDFDSVNIRKRKSVSLENIPQDPCYEDDVDSNKITIEKSESLNEIPQVGLLKILNSRLFRKSIISIISF